MSRAASRAASLGAFVSLQAARTGAVPREKPSFVEKAVVLKAAFATNIFAEQSARICEYIAGLSHVLKPRAIMATNTLH